MPGMIGYDLSRARELDRRARAVADHLRRLPPCEDPLAADAISAVRLLRARLEDELLPAVDRIVGSTAMLDFSPGGIGVAPVSGFRSPADPDESGPPASNSIDSELNPRAARPRAEPPPPVTSVVLPNGWEYSCGPPSASTGEQASGCGWAPPSPWDLSLALLVASVLPGTGEVLDAYDCVRGDIPCELMAVPFVGGRAANELDEVLTAGARAIDATDVIRTFEFPVEESWRLDETLKKHFLDHGADFGSLSPAHYASQASDFLARGAIENLPTKIDSRGRIRIWDPATDTFGAYNPDGTTRTFYVLEPEKFGYESSLAYWEAQPG